MNILRIGSERFEEKESDRIVIEVNGVQYTITERFGKVNILSHDDAITISPCCANQIDVF